jgi:Flp pilus assembly protein CpaB
VTEAPGSPKAARLGSPSWLDARLVLGLLLVLASVLVGAKVLAGADAVQEVWVATRQLPAGAVLTDDDLELGSVRLFDAGGRYLTGNKPVGYVVLRGIGPHELVPVAALSRPGEVVDRRDVTVPVPAGHLPPDLATGHVVDVYVTPDEKAVRAGSKPAPRLVLASVSVARVVRAGGLGSSGQDLPVVLTVGPEQVLALVQALADGRIDLVRVPGGARGSLVATTRAP